VIEHDARAVPARVSHDAERHELGGLRLGGALRLLPLVRERVQARRSRARGKGLDLVRRRPDEGALSAHERAAGELDHDVLGGGGEHTVALPPDVHVIGNAHTPAGARLEVSAPARDLHDPQREPLARCLGDGAGREQQAEQREQPAE
jgi:hypothetical protein